MEYNNQCVSPSECRKFFLIQLANTESNSADMSSLQTDNLLVARGRPCIALYISFFFAVHVACHSIIYIPGHNNMYVQDFQER